MGTSPSATIHEVVEGTAHEIQLVTISDAVDGNFFLAFRGEETEDIPYNASAEDVKTN
jgi:hypothetical protein